MKRGPKKNIASHKNNSLKKSFYVRPLIWDKLNCVAKENDKEKSTLVNEALQFYFDSRFIKKTVHGKITVVSLFSGCGGMDLGFAGNFMFHGKHYDNHFKSNGMAFEVIFSGDLVKDATQEYRKNFQNRFPEHPIVNADIKEYLDKVEQLPKDKRSVLFPEEADVVIGGFPCQDFSVAGKRIGLHSDRGRLYLQMKRAIELLNPKIFVAENVKGLTNLGSALDLIKKDFMSTGPFGYTIFSKLHHAADFGVPQTRERVFIVGIRKDLDAAAFDFPFETHSNDSTETDLKPWVTARQVIHDLEKKCSIPNQDQISRAKNYGSHCQGNRKIKGDYPGPTIRAEHHGNIEFHYTLDRRLSVRECARIQTFPDDFVFTCSTSAAYKLIGNAVPPVLAWHIAESVSKAFLKWGK